MFMLFFCMKADELLYEVSVKDCEKAFQSLFEAFYPLLCIYSKRYIEDLEIREDIVQEVFISVWEQRKMIRINTSAKNYLITSVRNGCVNYLRRNNKFQEMDAAEVENHPIYSDSGDEIYSLEELERMLNVALEKLPQEYRKVYELSRHGNLKNTEIADSLGVSVKTVERHKKRINALLRKELKDFLPVFLF